MFCHGPLRLRRRPSVSRMPFLRSVRSAAGPAGRRNPYSARIARAPARAGGRAFAPARFARLIARASRRAHLLRHDRPPPVRPSLVTPGLAGPRKGGGSGGPGHDGERHGAQGPTPGMCHGMSCFVMAAAGDVIFRHGPPGLRLRCRLSVSRMPFLHRILFRSVRPAAGPAGRRDPFPRVSRAPLRGRAGAPLRRRGSRA